MRRDRCVGNADPRSRCRVCEMVCPMKRVICCLDGTWNHNRPGAILTNVCKLHQAIAASDGNGVQQVSHYIEGIVSAEAESMPFLTGGIGFGVDDRICKAYEVL